GRRAAPAAGDLDRRRADPQPDPDPLHDPGGVPLPGPVPALVPGPSAPGSRPDASRGPAVTRGRAIVRRGLAAAGAAPGAAGGPAARTSGRPPIVTPDAYKENADWKVAQPQDDALRGQWWEIFGDPPLAALEEQVSISNQGLAAAEATYQQARALVGQARSAFFPTVTVGLGYTRARGSDTLGNSSGTNFGTRNNQPFSNFQLPLDVAWTPDFWGRVRRSV